MLGGFPGGSVVRNPPSNAGDAGLTPCPRNKIPHASRQLSLHTATRESPHTATETQRSQHFKFKLKKKNIKNQQKPMLVSRIQQSDSVIHMHVSFFFSNYLWILVVLHLWCCKRAFLVVVSGSYSLVAVLGLLTRWLPLLQSTGSRCPGFSSCSMLAW